MEGDMKITSGQQDTGLTHQALRYLSSWVSIIKGRRLAIRAKLEEKPIHLIWDLLACLG